MLRQQTGDCCLSLADYISPDAGRKSAVGLFVLKVEDTCRTKEKREFDRLLRESLCARLTEALAEWMQEQVSGGVRMIRPAFGYSACPDHFVEAIGIRTIGCSDTNRSLPDRVLRHRAYDRPLRAVDCPPGGPLFQHRRHR